jgi:hypothetical protein
VKDANEEKGTNQHYPPPGDLLSATQVEKLNLEIENLRKKNKWEALAQFIPVIATFIGVVGFFFTVYQFQSQRGVEAKKDRISREADLRTRLQNQVRNDIDEILRSVRNQTQTVSRIKFLLDDVATVMESSVRQGDQDEKMGDIFREYEEKLTASLVILVRDDCDFTDNPRDVDLANAVIQYWDKYSDYLKEDLQKLDWILYKYARALQSLHDKNPGFFEHLTLNKETKEYEVSPPYLGQKNEPVLYGHFIAIADGFKFHIVLLDKQNSGEEVKRVRKVNLRRFQDALANRDISEYILGEYLTD